MASANSRVDSEEGQQAPHCVSPVKHPLLEWRPGRRSPQQAFGADVFVDVEPVGTVSPSGNLPIAALLVGGVEQTGIPGQRRGERAAVLQAHTERVFIEGHIRDSLIAGGHSLGLDELYRAGLTESCRG